MRIPSFTNEQYISPELIIRIEASSNYSKVFVQNSWPIVVSKVLQWFEASLAANMFVRIHRSHLINKLFVVDIVGCDKKLVHLSNGEGVPVKRRQENCLSVKEG